MKGEEKVKSVSLRKLFLPIFCTFICCCTVGMYAALPPECNCRAGQYCLEDNTCVDCPAGMYCTNGESHLCGPGYYQNQQGQSSCEPCPADWYPVQSHIVCDQCNTGNFVVTTYDNEKICTTCEGATPYANVAHNQCVACNTENFIHDNGVCIQCSDDTPYANEEHTQCVACNTGNYIPDEYGVCRPCENNQYANEEHNQCVTCDTGNFAHERGVCVQCSGDTPYANEEHGECVACDKDAYIIGTDGVCKHCSGETPYANPNHTKCVICDDGEVIDGVCYPNCSTGQYVNDDGLCKKCPSGYYVNNEKKCDVCPAGNYCGGDGNMNPCPDDTFSAPGQRECSKCPDGYTKISRDATYIAGESLDNLCKKIEIKIKIGATSAEIPKCLKPGKINSRVVRQR